MQPPLCILVVDDDPLTLEALSDLLSDSGQVLSASLPSEALALLAQHSVDVVVSDQVMPEMTGDQFLRIVMERWPFPERILITGFCDMTSVVRAVNNGGICQYFNKPWDNDELIRAVEAAGRRGRERRVEQKRTELLRQDLSDVRQRLRDSQAWLQELRDAQRSPDGPAGIVILWPTAGGNPVVAEGFDVAG
ncbi:MAG: response regulator [Candidatus Eremiobacterota bacterium]